MAKLANTITTIIITIHRPHNLKTELYLKSCQSWNLGREKKCSAHAPLKLSPKINLNKTMNLSVIDIINLHVIFNVVKADVPYKILSVPKQIVLKEWSNEFSGRRPG